MSEYSITTIEKENKNNTWLFVQKKIFEKMIFIIELENLWENDELVAQEYRKPYHGGFVCLPLEQKKKND